MSKLSSLLAPELHTARLTLQRLDPTYEAHVTCALDCFNSPTAHAAIGDRGIRDPAAFLARMAQVRTRGRVYTAAPQPVAVDQPLMYIIYLRAEVDAARPSVGAVSIQQRTRDMPPDMGWMLREGRMGAGYAAEAAAALVRHVTEDLGVRDVVALMVQGYERSARVALKAGFVLGGQLRDEDGGKPADAYILPGRDFERMRGLRLTFLGDQSDLVDELGGW